MPAKQSKNKNARKNGKVRTQGYGPMILAQTPAIRIKMPWTYGGNIAEATAGAGAYYTFSINNMYDPNFTGTGTQPIGYDQYSALYGRYRVLSARVEVFACNRTAVPTRVGYYFSPQSTLPVDPNAWTVQNCTARQNMLGPNTGSNNVVRFEAKAHLPALFGITPNEYKSDQDFSAATGSTGPARLGFMHLWISSLAGVVAAVDFTASIWFDTEWSNPVALNMS